MFKVAAIPSECISSWPSNLSTRQPAFDAYEERKMAWVFCDNSTADLQGLSRQDDIAVKLFRVCRGLAQASRLGPQLSGFEHGFGIEW